MVFQRSGLGRAAAVFATGAALLSPLAAAASTYGVSDSAWGSSSQVNSLAWALAQANANPGADTITIAPGLVINVDAATAGTGSWLATVSDGLTIQGNGASLVGNPSFITTGGQTYTKFNVDRFSPPPLGSDILTQQAFSFAKVNPGVTIGINGLTLDGLNGFLQLGNGANATISNGAVRNTVSYGGVGRSVFEALDNSILNISNLVLDRINPALQTIDAAWEGAIAGTNATLNMIGSRISNAASAAGAVVWSGGVANIVSSIIENSGGISIRDDTSAGVMNLVNSLISISAQNSDLQRVQAIAGGELNITASTLLQDALQNSYGACTSPDFDCDGKPLTALQGGVIRLRQSVVSLINADVPGLIPAGVNSYSEAALGSGSGGDIQALDSVWVQTTPSQSAAALQSLMGSPGLLTAGSPFLLQDFGGGLSGYQPLPAGAVPNPTGPLRNQIADANGLNQLINPIDGSVIQLDVLGNPRSRNGLRDIGAIQSTEVPGPLPLSGAAVALAWSRRLRRRIMLARFGVGA